MLTLQQQHRSLQQSVVVSESTTGGSQQISTDKIEALKSSVTSLKVEHAQTRSDTERLQNVLREKNSSLMVEFTVPTHNTVMVYYMYMCTYTESTSRAQTTDKKQQKVDRRCTKTT